MRTPHRNWFAAPWVRAEGESPPIAASAQMIRDLLAHIEGRPDDSRVMITADMLRALAAAAEPVDSVEGATIRDHEHAVTYHATIGRGQGRVWLRTLEIVPAEGQAIDRPLLHRVPVQQIADVVAVSLAENREPDVVMIRDGEVNLPSDTGVPSSEEIVALVQAGETRHTLAVRYDRSLSTMDDWLGRARRELPDQMPPRRRGGRPQRSSDGKSSPANRK